MDLGTSSLTDEQLLELLQEACVELGNRDPFLRKMAQSVITDEAERVKLQRQALQAAVVKVRKQYVSQLQGEIQEGIKREIQNGELQVLSREEELKIITSVANKTKEEIRKYRVDQLQEQTRANLHADVISGHVDIYSQAEKDKMVADATASAEAWMKQHGIIPLEAFAAARQKIYDNLRKMGHSHDAIMAIYGPADSNPGPNPIFATSLLDPTNLVNPFLKKP